MEKETQKPAFSGWPFLAALIITIFFVTIVLVWQNNKMDDLKQEVSSKQSTLATKVEKIENGEVKKAEVVEEALDPTEDWETFKIAGYSFLYPDNWTYDEQDSNRPDQTIYAFFDENGERVGLLFAPISETGFTAMEYDQKSRSYKKDGALYKAFLWEGRPDLTEYPEYYETAPEKEMLLFMGETSPSEEFAASALFIIRNLEENKMVKVANLIYESIK